jgi:trehalose-6-phosphate synthase
VADRVLPARAVPGGRDLRAPALVRAAARGLLGADVIAFHTDAYRENFVRTCARLRDDVRVEGKTIVVRDRRVHTAAHPISIDAAGAGGTVDPDRARAAPIT